MGWNAKTSHTPYALSPAGAAAADESTQPDEAPPTAKETPEEPGVESGRLPVTPIPDTPDVGHAFGEPVLVGGADLLASTATLVSYNTVAGPQTVLHARVCEDAEEKLLEALTISPEMVPAQVEQLVSGRLPIDEKHVLADKIITAAKSVNHHIKNGDLVAGGALPATTMKKIDDAETALEALADELGEDPSPLEQSMLDHYISKLNAVHQAASSGAAVDQVTPFLHEGTATVTVMVPATGGEAMAILRDATRIKPHLDAATGMASWDGARSGNVSGKEYAIDLGDGYQAVYRPYSINHPATTEFSLRGRLELIAPAGEGHGPELVQRLGQLNLANRPMTRDEGEYTYLTANVTAQNLTGHAGVTAATKTGEHLEEMVRQEIFYERAHQAVGMDDAQLARFAKTIQLEAHTRALPAKVQVLREAIAKATGYADGTTLAASTGYDPTPQKSAGWLTWSRFDVANSLGKLGSACAKRSLVHTTSYAGLKSMLATGVLASTERRTTMGIAEGMGTSESTDKFTGGASSVFLRVKPTPSAVTDPMLVWDRPEKLLSRADYYGANGDTFGVINPAQISQYSNATLTRDPFTIAGFGNSSNEVMFSDGIDLLGIEGPSRILCKDSGQRDELRTMLMAKGITHIAGKPIKDVVTC
ncbi:hypothetical protein ILP97_18100 [Amycolatopsis sp. H6(2020)]|nr:hypothetical protein [Amycolatopsis sp. H6(2020)]